MGGIYKNILQFTQKKPARKSIGFLAEILPDYSLADIISQS